MIREEIHSWKRTRRREIWERTKEESGKDCRKRREEWKKTWIELVLETGMQL